MKRPGVKIQEALCMVWVLWDIQSRNSIIFTIFGTRNAINYCNSGIKNKNRKMNKLTCLPRQTGIRTDTEIWKNAKKTVKLFKLGPKSLIKTWSIASSLDRKPGPICFRRLILPLCNNSVKGSILQNSQQSLFRSNIHSLAIITQASLFNSPIFKLYPASCYSNIRSPKAQSLACHSYRTMGGEF